MSYNRGLLVVLEGANGAGKTTIINELVEYLRAMRMPASFYKLPDRAGINGKKIDQYLKGLIKLNSKYEILDMFSGNRRTLGNMIKDDLSCGKVVICDRYVFSAIAYQIPPRVYNPQVVKLYCDIIGYFDRQMPMPDLVYLIEGDHLRKRGISYREIFHYHGDRSRLIKNMLNLVIRNYTSNFVILKNHEGHLDQVVSHIIYDIGIELHRKTSAD